MTLLSIFSFRTLEKYKAEKIVHEENMFRKLLLQLLKSSEDGYLWIAMNYQGLPNGGRHFSVEGFCNPRLVYNLRNVKNVFLFRGKLGKQSSNSNSWVYLLEMTIFVHTEEFVMYKNLESRSNWTSGLLK